MKNNWVILLMMVLTLVLGGAAEEMLPKVLGVGFPVLLAAVVFNANRRSVVELVLFATAAGALEDALSALPFMTSISFFVITAAIVRKFDSPRIVTVLTFPLFQIWAAICAPTMQESIFIRILLSIPFALIASSVVVWILSRLESRFALNENE